jgi:hypothetical protein
MQFAYCICKISSACCIRCFSHAGNIYWFDKEYAFFIQIFEGDNLEYENSFYIRGSDSESGPARCVELYTDTQGRKKEWMDALWTIINDAATRRQSFSTVIICTILFILFVKLRNQLYRQELNPMFSNNRLAIINAVKGVQVHSTGSIKVQNVIDVQ